MITLIIDGQEVHAEEGQTVLEVARENGIEIPTLCYHPLLEPYGACRLCTVEIQRGNRVSLDTSCTYPAADGMVVETRSPQVMEARRMLLGLLLSRCPNVPVIQDMAREYGVVEPPFPTDTPDEECILCGLCVRVCHEIVGAGAISFANRGVDREVGPPFLEKTLDCIGCGACTIVCPTGAIEIVDEARAILKAKPLGPISAIYVPSLQAVPLVPVIDTDACIRFRRQARGEAEDACGACAELCEAGAIHFDQEDEILELEVGNIILATGFQDFDPRAVPEYGYGRLDNVFTSLEFERMCNAAGITEGKIVLHDGVTEPKSVAIIHCVGSRDKHYNPYCSNICCMAALKFGHLVMEKTDAKVTSFYIDMRTPHKGYEEFYERLQEEGMKFVRGRAAEVTNAAQKPDEEGKLIVQAEDTLLGKQRRIPVDMVILMAALEAQPDAKEVALRFGISCSANNWFIERHPKLDPVATMTDGVFIAGVCQGPKDIPASVSQGAAAAARVLGMITKGTVLIEPIVATINEDMCSGCRICNDLCPFNAIEYLEDKEVSYINSALCKGCGTCVAACPAQAITGAHFSSRQIITEIEGLLYDVVGGNGAKAPAPESEPVPA